MICILSGGNNDISRYPDIVEKSLLYKDLKHYFLITFGQRPGELKKYINKIYKQQNDFLIRNLLKEADTK